MSYSFLGFCIREILLNMQSLSFWSFKSEILEPPTLSSSYMLKRKKKKYRWEAGGLFCDNSSCSIVTCSLWKSMFYHRLSFCQKKLGSISDCKLFDIYPKPNCVHVYSGNLSTCRVSVVLVSGLGQETVGDDQRPSNVFKGKSDMMGVDFSDIEHAHRRGTNILDEELDSSNVKDGCQLKKEKGSKVDVKALAWSLRLAKNADDVEEVLKDFEDLPLPVYSSMIKGFGTEKKLAPAIALVEWLKKKKETTNGSVGPNLYIYNSLLGAMKQTNQVGEVDKFLEDMVSDGIVPNIVTYNTLMAIYLEQGQPQKTLDIFYKFLGKDLVPSPVSYSTALLAYRRMEDGEGALNFFVETRKKYDKGDIGNDPEEDWENEIIKLEKFAIRICYQVMRRWLVKGDLFTTKVLKLLTDVDKAALQPDRSDYEKLVWACTLENHYTVARELYRRIREKDNEISLSVCNHVIWLMGKAKKWWAALEIYEDLLDKGPQPNNLSYELIVYHFNILLTAARKRGIWRWGVKLLNKMQDKGLKPGSREWNAVLVACSKASETAAAVQIFRRMVEQGEKPTIISYGALLSALEKGNLYDEALQVWEHMCKIGVKPNLYAYTILVSVYIGQGRHDLVDSVIREMISAGVEPTVVTFNAIITGCTKSGLGGAAFEWFHRMKLQNIAPNEITYDMLIEALARDGKPRLAYEMYLRARNEGLQLSPKAYDSVVLSARHYGASIDSSALGPRPWEKKKIVKTRKTLSEFCDLADVPRRGQLFDKKEIYASQTQEKL